MLSCCPKNADILTSWVALLVRASPRLACPPPCIQELLHEDDRKLFANLEKEAKAGKQESNDFVKAFREYKQKMVPAAQKPEGKSKGASGAQGSSARSSKHVAKPRPEALPAPGHDKWNNDTVVQAFLPTANYRVYYDRVNRRCKLFWVSERRARSFAWSLYGIDESAKRCLKIAWDDHRGLTGGILPLPAVSKRMSGSPSASVASFCSMANFVANRAGLQPCLGDS